MTVANRLPRSTTVTNASQPVDHLQPRMYAVQAPQVRAADGSSSAPHNAHQPNMSRVPIAALLRSDSVEKFDYQGRTYYKFRNDTYILPADDAEYERLDIMHQLIYINALSNNLHLAHLRTSPSRILDVGFGTGFWMLDIEKRYPQAEVIGIDLDNAIYDGKISGVQCHFKAPVDFTAPQWPVEDSSVDLVHMAQLAGCVPNWLQHYRKAYKCLRPGVGHIEHVEIDWAPRTTDPQFPGEARDIYNWWYWMQRASEHAGKSLAIRDDHDDLLEDAGFRDVSHRRIRVPLFWNDRTDPQERGLAHGYQIAMGHTGSQSFHGFSMLLLTKYLNWHPQQVQELCDNVVQVIQSRHKFSLYMNIHVWTARRPQT